jgi:DNA end-binding protein Ku
MTGKWNPADYGDKFTHAIHELAAQRVKAGKTAKVTSLEGDVAAPASNVVDLTELLKKSLESRKSGNNGSKADAAPGAHGAKTASRKAPAKAASRAKLTKGRHAA